jgi:hypothetical protein
MKWIALNLKRIFTKELWIETGEVHENETLTRALTFDHYNSRWELYLGNWGKENVLLFQFNSLIVLDKSMC